SFTGQPFIIDRRTRGWDACGDRKRQSFGRRATHCGTDSHAHTVAAVAHYVSGYTDGDVGSSLDVAFFLGTRTGDRQVTVDDAGCADSSDVGTDDDTDCGALRAFPLKELGGFFQHLLQALHPFDA